MKQLLLLLRTEVKCKKNKYSWIWFMIIVLITLLISTFWHIQTQKESASFTTDSQIMLGIANQDTSEYSNIMLSYFKDNEEFSKYVTIVEGEETALKKQISTGKLDCLLVIPAHFTEQMIRMEHQKVQAWILTDQPTKAVLLNNVLKNYETYISSVEVNCAALYDQMYEDGFTRDEINKANVNISLELIFTALGKDSFFAKREIVPKQENSITEQYYFSSIFLLLMFLCFPVGIHIMKRESTGLARRIWMVNVSDRVLLVGYLTPYLILLVILTGMFVAPLAVEGHSNVIWTYLACLGLVLPVLLLVAGFGFLCRRRQTYLLFCSILFVFVAFIGGSLIPALYLPNVFLPITERMPNYLFVSVISGTMEIESVQKLVLYCIICTLFLFVVLFPFMKWRREGSQVEE